MPSFIGRTSELQSLDRLYKSAKSELFVLYGRRRVGKTALLSRFCEDKPSIHYVASQTDLPDNLAQFKELCFRNWPDLHVDADFRSLEAILVHLAQRLPKDKKTVIVLDEFQYLVQDDTSVPSQLQRFWDTFNAQSNIMLVLCGSSVSLMTEHTLAERSPLFGRRTGQLRLEPLDFRTASRFFSSWNAIDRLAVYGILGGMPAYLAQFDDSMSLSENIQEKILRKGMFLNEEVRWLLRTELRETRTYASILKLIAHGNSTLKDISSKSGLDGRVASAYLHTLQELQLVRRQVSMSERDPERNRKGIYQIQDNFVRFWFAFLEENLSLIDLDRASELHDKIIAPQLQLFLSKPFEEICRQFVLRYGDEIGLPTSRKVGAIWQQDFDIDVVAEHIDGSYTFGECKWAQNPAELKLSYKLKDNANATQFRDTAHHYAIFCPVGTTGTIRSLDVHSVSAQDMVGHL